MSLSGMMRTGASGMNAQASRLGTVADNIANSNTTGYKKASTQFSSLILPSGGGAYNSGGVIPKTRYSISEAGTYTNTTSVTDLAIKGEGFFIVRGTDGVEYLTRAGAFIPQADGTLLNAAGFTLMGYPYSSTADPTIVINGFAGLEPVVLSADTLNATPSANGELGGNLPGNEAVGFSKPTSLVAYDSQGNERLLNFTYEKTAANEWELTVDYEGTVVSGPTAVTFDAAGALVGPTSITTASLAIAGTTLNLITIDISNTTQLGGEFSADGDIDGKGATGVVDYSISSDGVVSLKYEDGELVPKYRLALATVQSPDMLTPLAGNVYSQSRDSGVVVVGYPENGGLGSIVSNTLEDSNVDIAEELTTMIESQRNYTANSKVFQTGSDLMDVLVNLKR
ncbi:MAG: flagellar hook protein FlgE [Rhizobiales bacterium]|nr:flagellar hook protein FlgE [Hyphomicrobiales bacterium]MBA70194.1 flagellar hook protein FlgE [Hyphomicrobiales bacterium]|tara:strand:- start:360 stop:1550 length:1191 start_codon:yes stop_codon:yes gene_type:complete